MDRAAIKLEAKEKIRDIRGSYVCIALIIFATVILFSVLANTIGSDDGAGLFTSAFDLLIMPVMSIAFAFFIVQGWRGLSPRTGDWMNAIFDRYGRKLGGYLWMSLKVLLWMLPFIAAVFLYLYFADMTGVVSNVPVEGSVPFEYTYQTGMWQRKTMLYFNPEHADKFVVPALIYLAMMVVSIRITYSYYFTTYVLAACPNVKARDAIKTSIKMTKGYRFKIFVAELSFLGWGFLSILTLGILFLCYVGPYMRLTRAGIFDTLKEEGIREGRLTYADFGEEAPEQEHLEDGNQA